MTIPQPQPSTPPMTAAGAPAAPVPAMPNALLIGPVGIIVAGLVGLIGALLPWVSTTMTVGSGSLSIQQGSVLEGFESGTPWPATAAGLGGVILLGGAVFLFARRIRTVPGITAAASLVLFGLGVFQVVDLYRRADALYDQMNRAIGSVSADTPGIERIDFRDFIHFDPAPGLWMIVAAGLLGTALSSLTLWKAKPTGVGAAPVPEPPPAPVPEPPPAGVEPQTPPAGPRIRPITPSTDGPPGDDSPA